MLLTYHQHIAQRLLRELESADPGVTLVQAPRPQHRTHFIRLPTGPLWYRLFYYEHGPWVKRTRVKRALKRIIEGRMEGHGWYVDRLREMITVEWGADSEMPEPVRPPEQVPCPF